MRQWLTAVIANCDLDDVKMKPEEVQKAIEIDTAEESTEQEFTDVSITEIGSTSDDSCPIVEYRTVKTLQSRR